MVYSLYLGADGEVGMGFKEYSGNMTSLDMELSKTLGSSRTQKFLREIHVR